MKNIFQSTSLVLTIIASIFTHSAQGIDSVPAFSEVIGQNKVPSETTFKIRYEKNEFVFKIDGYILTNKLFFFDLDKDKKSDLVFYSFGWAAHGTDKLTIFSTKYLSIFSTLNSELQGYSNHSGFVFTNIGGIPGIVTLEPNYHGFTSREGGFARAASNIFYFIKTNTLSYKFIETNHLFH